MQSFQFSCGPKREYAVRLWLPDGQPQMILQVAHGMTEHMGRYGLLGAELAKSGILTAGFDLPGHGHNPGDPGCASFGRGGWQQTLWDMKAFYDFLEEHFPGLPHVMMGFSLGSFLVQDYLALYHEPAAAVLIGTGCQPGWILSILKLLTRLECIRVGFDRSSKLVQALSFGAYNSRFAPNRTRADWLCADREKTDEYLADPLNRASISAGLFWQLLDSMQRTGAKDFCRLWNPELPVCILSGAEDPVGDFGKGVPRLVKQMKAAGMKQVHSHILAGCRHDLLHEYASGQAQIAVKILESFLNGLKK